MRNKSNLVMSNVHKEATLQWSFFIMIPKNLRVVSPAEPSEERSEA